ncbi:hypothetical protein DL764_004809 [Monosporascus ibericus]|uniref:Dynactin subunit 4 n=1 Tax=Monosporascus ibericus TaxID=155417 RepID=A0A4Q4TF58_9PEZI|nr:hypothetical protein DL764_004809 [Monosporascus ibericus]
MAPFNPYTYIQCPCNDLISHTRSADEGSSPSSSRESEEEECTFDPRAPRSNYSLYPLEYLLYCDVCHQIRCPRCVFEEIVNVYCPNCLFEVASSSLKTEGNRCTRSCFQCPICIGPLAVQAFESAPEPALLSADSANAALPSGPWILACSYCNWNSAEIGVKFDKPQGISAQLSKLRHAEDLQSSKHSVGGEDTSSPIKMDDAPPETAKARFSAMKAFYQTQLSSSNPNASFSAMGDLGFNSPGTLSRIMSLYSGGTMGNLKQKNKTSIMREAGSANEGLRVSDLDESAAMSKLRRDGWEGTITNEQAQLQVEEGARFTDELWPIPYLLRSKRSKRCPVCRHIISKPESKVGNTRWRIRLVANNYIPSISIKRLPVVSNPTGSPTLTSAPRPLGHHAHQQQPPPPPPPPPTGPLKPMQPALFLLTFKNPIFEEVKVTLASPATTPGRFASRVTVLCPEFSVGANTEDMDLDDVLTKDGRVGQDDPYRRRQGSVAYSEDGLFPQAEVGKIWDRGRNWVSIVVEVIPAVVRVDPPAAIFRKEGGPEPDLGPLREDEDVLEIPMFVRLEWEGEAPHDQVGTASGKEKDAKEKKELAYWCALGLGRICQD